MYTGKKETFKNAPKFLIRREYKQKLKKNMKSKEGEEWKIVQS